MTEWRMGLTVPVVAVALLVSGCSEPEPMVEKEVVRPVKIVTVGALDEDVTRDYPGTIKGAQNAELSFEVPGRIVEFVVQEGDQVHSGDILARLDDRDLRAELDKAEANLRKAEADLTRSSNIYEQDSGAISVDQIESDQRAVDVSKASLAQAQKAVDDTLLTAPFDGLAARRLVEEFQNVQAKEPVLLLQDIEFLQIEIDVPERDFTAQSRNLPLAEVNKEVKPRVVVSSVPDREFPARVTEMATAADPVTRTFVVTLAFENPEDINVLPGMTARAIVDPFREPGVWLPTHAVVSDSGADPFVWKVDPDSMAASRQTVQIGDMREGSIAITGGLEDGDLVAVSGVRQLEDGQRVRRYEG